MKFGQIAVMFRISHGFQCRQDRRYIAAKPPECKDPGLMISQVSLGPNHSIFSPSRDNISKSRELLSHWDIFLECIGSLMENLTEFLSTLRFVLQGRTEFAGALINSYGTWTVGRGYFNGKMTDDARDQLGIF